MAQNEQSYEQIYSDNEQQLQQESAYENQLMLDENDQIQLYTNQQTNNHKQNHNQNQTNLNEEIHQQKQSYQILDQNYQSKVIRDEEKQHSTQDDSDTQQVMNFLQTKYAHFDQQILIKMLYQQLFPSQKTMIPSKTKQIPQQHSKIQKLQFLPETQRRKDYQSSKKFDKTVKIFVQHGYGINIARQYADKGQIIQPNPYNNTIGRMIKQTWKAIELQVLQIKKSLKPLNTQKFNQIKTPLIHAKNWMQKKYIEIFNDIISYTHGLKKQKPSSKNYQVFYNYVMEKAKKAKNSVQKGFYKKKVRIQDKDSDQSNEQFRPPKMQKFSEQNYKHLTKVVKNSFKK